jgi:hypothetical protein
VLPNAGIAQNNSMQLQRKWLIANPHYSPANQKNDDFPGFLAGIDLAYRFCVYN